MSLGLVQRSELLESDKSFRRRLRSVTGSIARDMNLTSADISSSMDVARIGRLVMKDNAMLAPLFRGMGTHFAFIWVGTPPQRVSVIVDTGSHFTAFPCTGCKCAKHMDPYFNPTASNTSSVLECPIGSKKRCMVKQAYSEGSSWQAYKVADFISVGGERSPFSSSTSKMLSSTPHSWSVNMVFGCQSSETGLFRTQKVDGIMGMSASVDTLPYQLKAAGLTSSRIFSICMRVGGGVLTLGGVDPSVHMTGPKGKISYAQLVRTENGAWYTVKITDILLKHPKTGQLYSLGLPSSIYNSGKGAIVDSGTTDTYLPLKSKAAFEKQFKAISGMSYVASKLMTLSNEEFESLPTIVYRLTKHKYPSKRIINSELHADKTLVASDVAMTIDVESSPHSYVENLPNGKKAFRVYLNEESGTVLGANFMNDHNVIFDVDQKRIGFARSQCRFQDEPHHHRHHDNNHHHLNQNHIDKQVSSTAIEGINEISQPKQGNFSNKLNGNFSLQNDGVGTLPLQTIEPVILSPCDKILESPCSASCTSRGIVNMRRKHVMSKKIIQNRIVEGHQKWKNRGNCETVSSSKYSENASSVPCTVLCTDEGFAVRGHSLTCFDGPWSECSSYCTQKRLVATFIEATGECEHIMESRMCRSFNCPTFDRDFVVNLELKLKDVTTVTYSFVHREDLLIGIAAAIAIPVGNIVIFGPHPYPYSSIELRATVKIRVSEADKETHSSSPADRASKVVRDLHDPLFVDKLTTSMNGNKSSNLWRWLTSQNVEFVTASASPIRNDKGRHIGGKGEKRKGRNGLLSNVKITSDNERVDGDTDSAIKLNGAMQSNNIGSESEDSPKKIFFQNSTMVDDGEQLVENIEFKEHEEHMEMGEEQESRRWAYFVLFFLLTIFSLAIVFSSRFSNNGTKTL